MHQPAYISTPQHLFLTTYSENHTSSYATIGMSYSSRLSSSSDTAGNRRKQTFFCNESYAAQTPSTPET